MEAADCERTCVWGTQKVLFLTKNGVKTSHKVVMILGYSGDKQKDVGAISHLGGEAEKERKREEDKGSKPLHQKFLAWCNQVSLLKCRFIYFLLCPIDIVIYKMSLYTFLSSRSFFCFLTHKAKALNDEKWRMIYWRGLHFRGWDFNCTVTSFRKSSWVY